MNYPVSTPVQLRAVLKAMRNAQGLSQEQLGKLIGVSQRRIATIEASPNRASFDQLTKIVANLGGQLAIVDLGGKKPAPPTKQKALSKSAAPKRADW